MEFGEQPTDLAELHPQFGTAHLFIDDCADYSVRCCAQWNEDTGRCDAPFIGNLPIVGFCYNSGIWHCEPCEPYYHNVPPCDSGCNPNFIYWAAKCDDAFPECNNGCLPDWS